MASCASTYFLRVNSTDGCADPSSFSTAGKRKPVSNSSTSSSEWHMLQCREQHRSEIPHHWVLGSNFCNCACIQWAATSCKCSSLSASLPS